MSLQDFFEGAIRTATAAANSYLDAEIAYLQAKDARSKERARQRLAEERNKLLRQQTTFDQLMRMKEFQSKEARDARQAEVDKAKADKEAEAEKEREGNLQKYTKNYDQYRQSYHNYKKYPTDANWDQLEMAASNLRGVSSMMGDEVDVSFLDTDMEGLQSARDKKRAELDEQEKAESTDRINTAIREYVSDPQNEEKRQAAFAAALEGLEIDPDNPAYKNIIDKYFPDENAAAITNARGEEAQLEESYEQALSAYRKDPTNEELKSTLFNAGRAYLNNQKALGKDTSVLADTMRGLGMTDAPQDTDDDMPLSDADRVRLKEKVNGMALDEDKKRELISTLDNIESLTQNDFDDALTKAIMGDAPSKSKEQIRSELFEGYEVRSDNRALLETLVQDGHDIAAQSIDEVMSKRDISEMDEDDKNWIADKVLSIDSGPAGVGEVEGRITRSPRLIAERLAVVETAFERVKDKLDLSTAFVEGGLEKLGTADDADVREFASVAQRFMQEILRLDTGAQANIFEMVQTKKITPQLKNVEKLNQAIIDGLSGYVWGVIDQDFARRYTGEWGSILPKRLHTNIYDAAGKSSVGEGDAYKEQLLASLQEDEQGFIAQHKTAVQQMIDSGEYDVKSAGEAIKQSFVDAGLDEATIDRLLTAIFEGLTDEPENKGGDE